MAKSHGPARTAKKHKHLGKDLKVRSPVDGHHGVDHVKTGHNMDKHGGGKSKGRTA